MKSWYWMWQESWTTTWSCWVRRLPAGWRFVTSARLTTWSCLATQTWAEWWHGWRHLRKRSVSNLHTSHWVSIWYSSNTPSSSTVTIHEQVTPRSWWGFTHNHCVCLKVKLNQNWNKFYFNTEHLRFMMYTFPKFWDNYIV